MIVIKREIANTPEHIFTIELATPDNYQHGEHEMQHETLNEMNK